MKKPIKTCLENAVRATMPALMRQPDAGNFFGLYGMDLIIDSELNPWLTEILISPGLDVRDGVKAGLLPALFQECINIMMEIQYKKRQNQSILPLESLKRFELLDL